MSGDTPGKYVPPTYGIAAFNCPICNAYADQHFGRTYFSNEGGSTEQLSIWTSRCRSCRKISMWLNKQLIFPDRLTAPLPNNDMPDNVKKIYGEARQISNKSPTAACALLRVCIDKLCIHLGEEDGTLYNKIGNLVEKGLPPLIQKSLDSVRITGNDELHVGEINVEDNEKTVTSLFKMINIIVQTMISNPKMVESYYGDLPEDKLDGVNQRDQPS